VHCSPRHHHCYSAIFLLLLASFLESPSFK
jgi:hypothetical protein